VKVMGRCSVRTVDVTADGTGVSSRAGTALVALVAQRLGLTEGLCAALAGARERCSGHDPGRVFCDLAVMLADGRRCVSDVAALAGQPAVRRGGVGLDGAAGRALGRRARARPDPRCARPGQGAGVGGWGRTPAAGARFRRDAGHRPLREGAGGGPLQGRLWLSPAAGLVRAGGAGRDPAAGQRGRQQRRRPSAGARHGA
jgi:Transposase DDE domain group 1